MIVLSALVMLVQSAAAVKLEVASIKPVPSDRSTDRYVMTDGRTVRTSCTLAGLIDYAYSTRDYRVDKVPSWVQSQYYVTTVKAEGEGALTNDQFHELIRLMLEDRFHLQAHKQIERIPVYALVLDKGGPKFKESAPGTKWSQKELLRGVMDLKHHDMDVVAQRLTGWLHQRVVNLTGLTGFYDLMLEWGAETDAETGIGNPNGPSLFTAVKDQLGLRLELRKQYPIEFLIVDHAERPDAN